MTRGAHETLVAGGDIASRRQRWAIGFAIAVVAGPLVAAVYFLSAPPGDELAELEVRAQPGVVALGRIPAHRSLILVATIEAEVNGASARSWSVVNDGAGRVGWEIELLRDGEVVARCECDPFRGYLYQQSRSSLAGGDFDLSFDLRMEGCELVTPGGDVAMRVRSVPLRPRAPRGSVRIARAHLSVRN